MQLAEKINYRHGQALMLLQLGHINALHNHFELARRFENEALSIFRHLQDLPGIARSYDQLGLIDAQQKNLLSATQDLGQAMKYHQDTHDSTGILETYHGLGAAYEQKGDIEKALTYYLRVLVQYEHRNVKTEAYFLLLERIGKLYLKKGDRASAIRYLEEGIVNSNKQALRDTQIKLLADEGKIYEEGGNATKALSKYKQSLEEAKQYNQPEEEAKALINIAGILKNGNAAGSIKDLKQALTIAKKLHEPPLEARIYAAMAGVYRQEKDYKEALYALQENQRLLDSLLASDTTKEIAALDSSYQLESSREKIDTLNQTNKKEKLELDATFMVLGAILIIAILLWLYLRKVRKLNEELEVSNRIKDTLFSVIGHDLKGPAGSAAQLFNLMETEEFTEEEVRGMISELRKQTTASFELLNALFEWGRAQLQGVKVNAVSFDPEPVIIRNISLLTPQAAIKNIKINDDIESGLQIFADPDHFDFVIRNLLSNAIKFTYNAGYISVSAKTSPNSKEVIFDVADTGKGISIVEQQAFAKSSLQVAYGTNGEKGSGLGLLLSKDFMKANQGRIWLESQENKGTTFHFALPLDKA